jgi:hypothetical protein
VLSFRVQVHQLIPLKTDRKPSMILIRQDMSHFLSVRAAYCLRGPVSPKQKLRRTQGYGGNLCPSNDGRMAEGRRRPGQLNRASGRLAPSHAAGGTPAMSSQLYGIYPVPTLLVTINLMDNNILGPSQDELTRSLQTITKVTYRSCFLLKSSSNKSIT